MESEILSKEDQLIAIKRIMGRATTKKVEVLSFGEYKGMSLSDIPDNYLLWLSNNSDSDSFVEKIEFEIQRRKK